jgi:flagellar hook-basal body complex protein FliE
MVARADIQQVLMQMRQVRSDMQNQAIAPTESFAERIQTMQTQMQTSALNTHPLSDTASGTRVSQNYPDINPDPNVPNFQTMFNNAINEVNRKQRVGTELATKFEMGDPQVDLPEVMVALQKASVSFQAMTEVRNKLVEAYKDIMNMPV